MKLKQNLSLLLAILFGFMASFSTWAASVRIHNESLPISKALNAKGMPKADECILKMSGQDLIAPMIGITVKHTIAGGRYPIPVLSCNDKTKSTGCHWAGFDEKFIEVRDNTILGVTLSKEVVKKSAPRVPGDPTTHYTCKIRYIFSGKIP